MFLNVSGVLGVLFLSLGFSPLFPLFLCLSSSSFSVNSESFLSSCYKKGMIVLAMVSSLLLFFQSWIVLQLGCSFPFWGLEILLLLVSFGVVKVFKPEWSYLSERPLSFFEKCRNLKNSQTGHFVFHIAFLFYLCGVSFLALGGFFLFPEDVLRTGYSGLSYHILVFSGIVFVVGLVFSFLVAFFLEKTQQSCMPVFFIGIPGALFLILLSGLFQSIFQAFRSFDGEQLQTHLVRLQLKISPFFSGITSGWNFDTFVFSGTILCGGVALVIFMAYFKPLSFLKKIALFSLCLVIESACVALNDYWVYSTFLIQGVIQKTAEGKVEDLKEAEKSVERFQKLPSFRQGNQALQPLPFPHFWYQLASAYLALGKNDEAIRIFQKIRTDEKTDMSDHLQNQSKIFLDTLSVGNSVEVKSFQIQSLTPSDYLSPEWMLPLTLMRHLDPEKKSEKKFKKSLQKLSLSPTKINLPSIESLSHLKRWGELLNVKIYFSLLDKTLLRNLFKENLPFLVSENQHPYQDDFFEKRSVFYPETKLSLPICVDDSLEWLGVLDYRFQSHFKKQKDLNELESLIKGEEASFPLLKKTSKLWREYLKVLPMSSFFEKNSKNERWAVFVVPLSEDKTLRRLKKWIPDLEQQTQLRDVFSRAQYYYKTQQYLESFRLFENLYEKGEKREKGGGGLLYEKAGLYLKLLSDQLKRILDQRTSISMLEETALILRSFLDSRKVFLEELSKNIDPTLKDISKLPKNFVHTRLHNHVNHSWDSDPRETINDLLDVSKKAPNNRAVLLEIARRMRGLEDYAGLVEVIPRLLRIDPRLSAYELLYAHALLKVGKKEVAKKVFEGLPWLLANENILSFQWVDLKNVFRKVQVGDRIPYGFRSHSAQWNFLAGFFAHEEGREDKALSFLKRALQLDGGNEDFLKLTIALLEQKGDSNRLFLISLKNRLHRLRGIKPLQSQDKNFSEGAFL